MYKRRTGPEIGIWGRGVMRRCFSNVLDELQQSGYVLCSASGDDVTTPDLLEILERYHHDGYQLCVSFMLEVALVRGYFVLAERFLDRRHQRSIDKYAELSGMRGGFQLMRWLVEKRGAGLNIPTAIRVIMIYKRVETSWWLAEDDRVAVLCQRLDEKWQADLVWMLNNTKFEEERSRLAIRKAIDNAPAATSKWLQDNLHNRNVYRWCYPTAER
ncbi:hypothetical protein PHYPSEUDO_008439 [Phytophthora pseudosyringae]|uniref:Uncharacterized protein n=1 Tax=Phytophthora pseudosyringae TaxID=221518 RepID=A0A8T1VJI5_9STRA|nr:hypothetical protein PHYPSEUDO_008439 [Phytophthora pseudosyringae]